MSTDNVPASENGELENGNPAQPQADPKPGNVPYARFQEVVEQRKGLESTLSAIIDGMISELPEDMHGLVPNLPPTEKAAWIRKAKEHGLFSKAEAVPDSSPDAKRPGGKQTQDFSNMTPLQMMQAGYGHK